MSPTPKFAPVVAAVALLFAAPAWADTATLDDALDNMAASTAKEYRAARGQALGLASANRDHLSALAAPESWTRENWPQALSAAALLAHLDDPEAVAFIREIPGMDPDMYLRKRVPGPNAYRALRRFGERAVVPLLEAQVKSPDDFPFTTAASHPRLDKEQIPVLRAQERRALLQGLIRLLGQNFGDVRGIPFLLDVLESGEHDDALRMEAAASLGGIGTPESEAVLTTLLSSSGTPGFLRHGAALGLARVPTQEAQSALVARLGVETDDEVRRGIIVSLGAHASPAGWAARGEEFARRGATVRDAAGVLLVEIFAEAPNEPERAAAAQALATCYPESALPGLTAVREDTRRPADLREAAADLLAVLDHRLAR